MFQASRVRPSRNWHLPAQWTELDLAAQTDWQQVDLDAHPKSRRLSGPAGQHQLAEISVLFSGSTLGAWARGHKPVSRSI